MAYLDFSSEILEFCRRTLSYQEVSIGWKKPHSFFLHFSTHFRVQEEAKGEKFSIRLKGLPFRTREAEIVEWFSLPCTRVKILMNRDNRPSGEAIAEFPSKEIAVAAMKMNKQYLGDRYVVLTPLDF